MAGLIKSINTLITNLPKDYFEHIRKMRLMDVEGGTQDSGPLL